MSRKEIIGPYELHLGDCVEVLRDIGQVQALITDPPYSDHVHSSSMRGASGWKGAIAVERELGFASITVDQIQAMASFAGSKVARWSAVFSDTESAHIWREAFEEVGLEYVRTAFWRKLNGAPQFTGDRPAVACEAITLCHAPGRKSWNGGGKQGFYDIPIVLDRGGPNHETRVHTTQKPLALMGALICDFTLPEEVVLDAFMGSGTTGVACVRYGRRFVGIEADAAHFETACRRIEAATKQPDLFVVQAVAKPQQLSLMEPAE